MGRALSTARRIGPVGTAVRTLAGFGLIYLAGAADGRPWDVDPYDPIVGFVVLPVIMAVVGLGVRRYASRPIRLTGPLGIVLNLGRQPPLRSPTNWKPVAWIEPASITLCSSASSASPSCR